MNAHKAALLALCVGVTVAITFVQFLMFLPLCEMEDSTMCYWNAKTQGNGMGTSFITLWEGLTITL